MLNRNKAISKEVQYRKNCGPRYTYIFKCSYLGCNENIRVRSDALKTASGKCKTHSHTKKAFEGLYNRIRSDWRGLPCPLTYKQFLEFTKIDKCHYCLSSINWIPYSTVSGKHISSAYYLDRKNNDLGHSKRNCVVCCTRCNRARSNKFTYEEWYGMTAYFRK
jgi:hypothetical protein